MKKDAVTTVINDTLSGTNKRIVKWISEVLHAAQEVDSEIKPIL